MTKLLEQAVEEARKLPPELQDRAGRVLLDSTNFMQHKWSDAQIASIDRGIADAKAGRFATEEEMQALRDKYPSS